MSAKDEILDGLDGLLDGLDGLDDIGDTVAPISSKPKRVRAKKLDAHLQEAIAAAEVVSTIAAEPARDPSIDPALKHYGFSGKRVRIIVDRGHDPNDLPTQYFQLNNYTCTIARGEEVSVPAELLGVLDNAVQRSFSQPSDGVLIPHDSLRFSYRIVR